MLDLATSLPRASRRAAAAALLGLVLAGCAQAPDQAGGPAAGGPTDPTDGGPAAGSPAGPAAGGPTAGDVAGSAAGDSAEDDAADPEDADAPEGSDNPGELPLAEPPWELPCVVGAWITPPEACACPAPEAPEYTLECAAADCRQTELLLLLPSGDALTARLRYSGKQWRLSAVAGAPSKGTWELFDDGELGLEIDGNVVYTPTECSVGELQMKGHALMSRPAVALEAAVLTAWLTADWSAVPYFP